MSLNTILPTQVLSETEINLISEAFKTPAVKKYLNILAMNDTKELLGLSSINRNPEELVAAHYVTSGKLATLSTLMSLTEVQTKE